MLDRIKRNHENKNPVTHAFHTDINDNTSGVNDINASYYLCFRFLSSDGHLKDDDEYKPIWPSGLWATSQGGETS
jgi:hypothetical protein